MKKTVVAALTLLFTAAVAQAIDAPNMKEGLWKFHMVTTSPGSAPSEVTHSLCRDHAFDQRTHEMAMKQTGCVITEGSASSSKRTFTGTCKVGATTITSVSTVTYSGDTNFHSETTTTYTPAFYGRTRDTMVQDQTYIGACPSGMQPGDIIGPDGKVQHRHL